MILTRKLTNNYVEMHDDNDLSKFLPPDKSFIEFDLPTAIACCNNEVIVVVVYNEDDIPSYSKYLMDARLISTKEESS